MSPMTAVSKVITPQVPKINKVVYFPKGCFVTPRQNLLKLLRKQGYDSVPVQFYLCPALQEAYLQNTKQSRHWQDYFALPMREVEFPIVPAQQDINWRKYYPEGLKDGVTFDDWGIAYEPGGEEAVHMKRLRHPMAAFSSLEQFQAYPFPDFESVSMEKVAGQVRLCHDKGLAVYAAMECTVWETSWYLRSMEMLMMDMAAEDEKALWLLDKITDLACIRAAGFAACDVDVLRLGDDVGMQSALMMSENFYCTFLKPHLAKVIGAARKVKPDIIIQYHSCGYVLPLIEDFIEAGIDVLNPVQPECMNFADIHARFGDRLSFSGTIGTQTVMPFGSCKDVRETVFRNLDIAGPKGGLLCCPTHILEPEVPWDNIMAYVQACRDYSSR